MSSGKKLEIIKESSLAVVRNPPFSNWQLGWLYATLFSYQSGVVNENLENIAESSYLATVGMNDIVIIRA